MRAFLVVTIICCSLTIVSSTTDAEDGLSTDLQLWELDFEDKCADAAKIQEDMLSGVQGAYNTKVTYDNDYHDFMSSISTIEDIRNENIPTIGYSPALNRKLKMFATPGDILLDKGDWDKFVTFTNGNERRLQSTECTNSNICYKDVQSTLASSRNLQQLKDTASRWSSSPRNTDDFVQVLPFIKTAAVNNKFATVELYWEELAEKQNGYLKAKELWADIEPLYMKLHQYVTTQLIQVYGEGALQNSTNIIPSYLLGSSNGLDWEIVADTILPHPYIYDAITESLKHQNIGGDKLYRLAQNMLIKLGLGGVNDIFWFSSKFNETCPAKIIQFCQKGNAIVYTCGDTGWSQFLDAHKTLMDINHQQLAAEDDLNTYILRYGNRHSAVNEAVQNLANLLAVDPHNFNNFGILSLNDFTTSEHEHNNHLSLLLLTALRELPKLPYYLAADIWRMEVLKNHEPITKTNLIDWWKGMRFDFTKVSTYDAEFMDDSYILENKPYLGKFFGTILQFQLWAKLKSGVDYGSNFISDLSTDKRLKNLMKSGMAEEWPDLLNEFFGITEIDASDLLDYFSPLYKYMEDNPIKQKVTKDPSNTKTLIIKSNEKTVAKKPINLEDLTSESSKLDLQEEEIDEETEVPFLDKDTGGGVTIWAITVVGLIILVVIAFVVRRKIKERRDSDNNKKYQV